MNQFTIEDYMLHGAELPKGCPNFYPWCTDAEHSFDEIPFDAQPSDLSQRLNCSTSTFFDEAYDNNEFTDTNFAVARVRAVDAKALRGLPVPITGHRFQCSFFAQKPSFVRNFFFSTPDISVPTKDVEATFWSVESKTLVSRKYSHVDMCINRAKLALGFQFYTELLWTAIFVFEDKRPCVKVALDEDATKDFLTLRDTPEGKERKDAVIHFVSSHARRYKKTGKTAQIPTHLRGHVFHAWNGCEIRILPPVSDTVRLKQTPKVVETRQLQIKS